jgi:hypothetical protein
VYLLRKEIHHAQCLPPNQIPNGFTRAAGMVIPGCLQSAQRRFKEWFFLSFLFVVFVSNDFPQSGQ